MALIIRMRQQGANSRQRFRVVVTDVRTRRDGKYVENLGWYNPFGQEGKNYEINIPRVEHWLGQGAQISNVVEALVKRIAPEVIKARTANRVAKAEKLRAKRKAK